MSSRIIHHFFINLINNLYIKDRNLLLTDKFDQKSTVSNLDFFEGIIAACCIFELAGFAASKS